MMILLEVRNRSIVAVLSLLFAVLLSQSAQAQVAWSSIERADLGYSAEFPGLSVEERKSSQSPRGPFDQIDVHLTVNQANYRITTATYPFDIDQNNHVNLTKSTVSSVKGAVLSSQEMQIDGHRTIDVTFKAKLTDGNDYIFITRNFIKGRRIWSIVAAEPINLTESQSRRFVNSFRLTGSSGPSHDVATVSSAVPAVPALAAPLTASVSINGAGPRIALVIGNGNYGASMGDLANPSNDADMIAVSLRSVGFDVQVVKNVDQRSMKRAISSFGERLRQAGRGSIGLFYYAGHGIQSRGTNYLIPVGAAIEAEADVDLESVAADTVLLQMEEAGSSTNIVILDACRNMPIARSFRSGSRGLARMEAPNGSFLAYSTAPGAVAADGDGKNSPFAIALAQQIGKRGQPIEVVFRDVRRGVLESTGGKQTPWDSSSLISPFYFVEEPIAN